MGKRKLWTGIIVGATIGGLVSLFNEDTRDYVKNSTMKAYDSTNYYVNNPSLGMNKIKQGVTTLNQFVTNNTDGAINTLEQVENSLTKLLK